MVITVEQLRKLIDAANTLKALKAGDPAADLNTLEALTKAEAMLLVSLIETKAAGFELPTANV